MYPYTLPEGESPYSIENWPVISLEKRSSGWYTSNEVSKEKISFPKLAKRQQYGYEQISVIGSSLTSLAFAFTLRQKGIMGDISIFTEEHDFIQYGYRRSPSDRGAEQFVKLLDTNIFECKVLHGVNTVRKYVLMLPTIEKEIPAYLANQEDIKNVKHPFIQLMIAPNKEPAVPAGIDTRANVINLELDVDTRQKLLSVPTGQSIKAVTSTLRHLEPLAEAAAQGKSVKLFADFSAVTRSPQFYKWIKADVLKQIELGSSQDYKNTSGKVEDGVTWAVEATKVNLERYGHLLVTKPEGLVAYTNGYSYNPELAVGGPASLVPVASLAKSVTPLPNLQVQQGKAAANAFTNNEDAVNGVNVQCFELASRNVCEVGEVDKSARVWEHGSPQNGDYLSIFTDNSGMIHGGRSVGPSAQRKLALLHEGLISGRCFPKRKDFYQDPKGWSQLETCLLKEIQKNHNILRGFPIHRR